MIRNDSPEPNDAKELQEASSATPKKKGKECLSPVDVRRGIWSCILVVFFFIMPYHEPHYMIVVMMLDTTCFRDSHLLHLLLKPS